MNHWADSEGLKQPDSPPRECKGVLLDAWNVAMLGLHRSSQSGNDFRRKEDEAASV
jgi:hypothetical protein